MPPGRRVSHQPRFMASEIEADGRFVNDSVLFVNYCALSAAERPSLDDTQAEARSEQRRRAHRRDRTSQSPFLRRGVIKPAGLPVLPDGPQSDRPPRQATVHDPE